VLSRMARCAALYFGRASPRTQPLTSMATDLGVLVCEALRSRSEQLANKYPEAVGYCRRSWLKPLQVQNGGDGATLAGQHIERTCCGLRVHDLKACILTRERKHKFTRRENI